MLNSFLKPFILIFAFMLPAWILFRLLKAAYQKRNHKSINLRNEAVLSLFFIYVSALLVITIVPAGISGLNNPKEPGLNIIPFINTYRQFVGTLAEPDATDTHFALENIIGNFILFIPLGVFLPCIFIQFNTIKKVAACSFLCSGAIELIQLILRQFGTYRTVDIDDIILNTLGGIVGWLLFKKLFVSNPVDV